MRPSVCCFYAQFHSQLHCAGPEHGCSVGEMPPISGERNGAGPGQLPQWNYLGQETAPIRQLTEIFHRSSDSDTSYDPA